MEQQIQTPPRFLRIVEVTAKVSLSKPTIYRMVKDGRFPKSHKIGSRASAWLESEIDSWMMSKVEGEI